MLQALATHGRPMALSDLARAAGMPPGRTHPYLVSFGKIGLVKQDAATGHYWLGPMAIQLGLVSLHTLDTVGEATPFALALAQQTQHSVALAVWGNQGPTIVRLIDPVYPLHVNLRTGTVMSLAGTSTGRIFAAYLPEKLIAQSMKEDFKRLGPDIARPLKPEEIHNKLDEVRRHGLSRSISNPTPGVNAFAAPVFDYSGNMVMSITLMGSSGIFDTSWTGAEARAIKACASEVSKRLGYMPSAKS